MKIQQYEMSSHSTGNMLHPFLQEMFKMSSLCTDTSPEMSSPFVSRLIDNCLLYARPDRTQMQLQLVFQMYHFQISFKVVVFRGFVLNSFISLLARKPSNSVSEFNDE